MQRSTTQIRFLSSYFYTKTERPYTAGSQINLVGKINPMVKLIAGADPGEGKRLTIPPLSLSLSLLAVICSRFFVVEVIFLFFLKMTKGDNKKISKLCFYQKSYHGCKRHHFNHINEPTNTFGQLVTINSIHNIIENVPQTYQRNIDRYIH